MSDLLELYQELILDHNKRPRNRGALEHPDREAEGFNPLCGDRVQIDVRMDGEVIGAVRFDGAGCAISTASASLMSEAVEGRTPEEARALCERFVRLVTGGDGDAAALGKLAAFAGVGRFPARVKCATLAWHTLMAALKGEGGTVSTE